MKLLKQKRKLGRKLLAFLLTLAMIVGLMPEMRLTVHADVPYASIKNTTTEVHFDDKVWYLIDYDNDTVTLLSKECVGASAFDSNGSSNTYNGSTVETYVNNWYTDDNNISADAKTAVSGSGAFLLTTDQANAITNTDVRKCSQATGFSYNCWWLSSRDSATYATCVDGDSGDVYIDGGPVGEEFGVRPALKLDLSKVTFDSTSKTFTAGAASAPDTYYSSYVPTGNEDAEGLAAKQVTFNGLSWYIIQDNSTAVDAGTVTLLAKNPIGTSKFDDDSNAYATSDVRDYLVALTVDGGQFANAADAIVGTNLDDVNVTGEKLYLLSIDEAEALSENVRKCDPVEGENIVPVWLLRSTDKNPDSEDGVGCVLCDEGEVMYYKPSEDTGSSVFDPIPIGTAYVTCNIISVCSVRPALQLDLSKVVFNSGTNTFSLPVPDPVASVTTSGGSVTEYTLFSDALNAWENGSTLKLLSDAEIGSTIHVNNKTVTFDLNGHGIIFKGTNLYQTDREVFGVGTRPYNSGDSNLTLIDSSPDSIHFITLDNTGRGISVSDTGTESETCVKVTGGYITGGAGEGEAARRGGGVYVYYYSDSKKSNFTMNGGTIVGNTASCNSTGYGAGVFVSQKCTFTMNGGTITGNTAKGTYLGGMGGGVYVNSSGANCGSFIMNGGTITDNKVDGTVDKSFGGGVYNTGEFVISRNAVIKENLKGSDANNVYLPDKKTIAVTGALDGADIGVTMATPGVFTSSTDPIKSSDYKDQFSSDDSTYSVMIQENELKLGTHEHSFTYSADGATITATCSNEGCDLTDKKVTLTIVKPVLETYGGTGETAATLDGLDTFNTATGQAIAATQIKYVGRDGTTYAESATAPLAAGKYTAGITLAGVKTSEGEDKSVIASVDYEIAKADQTVNAPVAYQNLVYDGKSQRLLESRVTVSVGNWDAVVQYKTGEDGDWEPWTPYATDAGQYTLYYKVPGNENYNDFTGSVTATIAKADQEVEAPVGREDLVYTGYFQQLIDNLPYVVKGNTTSTPEYKVDDDDWSMFLPSAVSVGSHTVYYRIPESDNYNAYEGSIQVSIAKADPAAPTGLTATYGQTLADVNLPAGWTWVNSTVSVGNAGTHSFQANCNPTDTGNYNTLSNVDLSVTVSAAEPTANAPTGLTATYGQTLADVTLTNPEGNTPGTWEFVEAGTTSVGNAGEQTFQVKFTPTDAVNYNTLSNVDVTVTVNKADQTSPAAPTKDSATTNSITLTAVDGCEYRMGTDGTWQETPTFTGLTINTEYTFYQRLKEDANHNASPVSQSATISTNNHVHEWSYAAGTGENADTITATCANTDGGHDGELTARITVVKPEKTTYGDSGSANATIEGSIVGVTNPDIVYKKGTEVLTSAPTEAGTYTASITLGGATASVEYTIARKQVTVSGITVVDKTYDGNTAATLVTTAAIFDGKLSGDTLTVSAVGAFENANAGENKAVTISGLTLEGTDKDNYVLATQGQQTNAIAKISAKEIGLSWSNTDLTYTGEAQKPIATATGLVEGDICTVTVSGEQTNVGDNYTATASALSNSNYKLPENKTAVFKIGKADAVAATVAANDRTYDGTEMPLLSVDNSALIGGEMQYVLSENGTTAPAEGWGTDIPSKTDAGTYYVWYKVVGDETHIDTEPVCVPVKIRAAIGQTVIFKVINGAWNDGTTEDKTVILSGYEGDALKLAADDIPAVGEKPDTNYKEGAWDIIPSDANEITADTVYTYTYAQKESISSTVTFKVENGTWNDGTTEDKTIILSGYEGDALKLAAGDIPAVGEKPATNYKEGSWDVVPSTDTEITKATTYTYKYAKKASISQTVTFKVENGTWNDGTTEDKTVILSGYEGDVLKLSADEIPSAGTKPDSDHKKGSWDTIPSTDTEITKDTTYTYTYADKEMITFTVTFKVKNGEWDDGGSADKTVTLSREIDEDLALIMKEGDIPSVGNKPSNGFKAGEWDVTPTPNILVSEDKVYTYTYAQKESISSTVTFKVENGTWNDGTTEDKTVILSGYEGDALKLAAGDIPAVGEKPDTNYKEGAWDIIPSDANEITADTVYTYKYVGKTAKSNTVTFKVENGAWNDGTTEDKTVILSGYEGDALKLAAGDIPAVGEKPDTNYKEGAWNVIPSTDTEITADTTYTYTYAEKNIVSHTVTFKVENGSWNDGTADDITVTLSGYEDEILKLADGQIPAVGAMPGENKKEGSWDTVPDMETAITDDITCTYRYNDKDAISVKVTFKVVNGSWNDGTALDKIVTISGYEGDSLMLTSDQIPLAGDKPSDTYKAGGWDAVPEADTELTTDVTYTYGYIKKDTVTYTAAFKVENGTWNDGTADDIIITLTGYEGDTLKFTSDDIPEAGEKPAETYKAGEWDTAFSAENVLTADTTYTYTYKEKSKISQIVTFKVVNGSWNDGTTEERIVTLNGYEGDSLKLSADQIPAAGGKPDNGYTEGEWDTVPVTDIELTEDAVYTYIYAEETEVVKPEYYIVGSADATVTEGDETDVEFTAKRSVDDEHCIDHHKDVVLGGVTLKAGRDYSVRHGSTIVTINGSVIKNLKPGVYTVKIIFDDGAVTTNLTVKERTKETTTETATETTTEVTTEATTETPQKPVEKKTDKNAATGDDVNLWIALMMLSMSGTIAMFTVKKKKHK